tara:strand:+ start:246 stop:458 length:213 start_codon:yes stop_codon:yes gene_type:complete
LGTRLLAKTALMGIFLSLKVISRVNELATSTTILFTVTDQSIQTFVRFIKEDGFINYNVSDRSDIYATGY